MNYHTKLPESLRLRKFEKYNMKKIFLVVPIILILASFTKTYAQEVLPLSTVKEIQQLKDSKKGKVLLINFWATWCKPCVKEFPDLVKLYNDYKDKGFSIVLISVDVPEDVEPKVIPFLKSQGVDFVTYYNKFDWPEDLINFIDKNWEGAIPSTYIYNKDGDMTADILGSRSYMEFEKEILKNLD
jgi:thiol-disulfide isomerase/thioredoxin